MQKLFLFTCKRPYFLECKAFKFFLVLNTISFTLLSLGRWPWFQCPLCFWQIDTSKLLDSVYSTLFFPHWGPRQADHKSGDGQNHLKHFKFRNKENGEIRNACLLECKVFKSFLDKIFVNLEILLRAR